ncbi:MAG TPA: adenosylcobalamin-dependent ribonucleoside-diphosphate reductase, partial [Candidatus Diapherotrites archaeon]|nr:adenosylcobalamin-dependent ribonucleoside-diphosphate reductase [Candidatus Diapherotrites archaeon]
AKAYILYRQQRAELRKEKSLVLEKTEIDEIDKRFDLNALRVLKSRYLRKDAAGHLLETPKQLFSRVAIHGALPDLLADTRVYDWHGKQKAHPLEAFDNEKYGGKLFVGPYALNAYHLEALKRVYDRHNADKKMKVAWGKFLEMLKGGEFNDHAKDIDAYFDLMTERKFEPNTPAIANFGNPLGMGSACFVMDVKDSIEDIMETLKQTSIIFKAGGGMGYNFSKLRPEGDFVSSTTGIASGPLSFMRLFDTMTEVIKQGGIRRGANMGILNSNHPDIEKFIKAKEGNKALRNFNISVLVMADFWDHYNQDKPYPLTNPRSGEVVRTVDPRRLFDMIVYQAWESAEPGVIFFDHVNKYNPFYEYLGPIVTTNPCGEVLLYPNESCNLGSINVWAFAQEHEDGTTTVDWDGMKDVVLTASKFLDNVIEVNKFPLPAVERMALDTRKIGLGIMGFGDLLYELKLGYDTEEGRKFGEQLAEFVNYYSKVESIELAKTRGNLPFYDKSFYPEGKLPFSASEDKSSWHFDWEQVAKDVQKYGVRNGYTTVIAPTGSISMIAGCSSGIEPVFSLVFEKNVKVGSFYYVDPVFERVMKQEGLYDEQLMDDICKNEGSLQNIAYMPPELKKTFVTARDLKPEDHIRMLAAFQRWVDSSISKTNNFPTDATVEDMRKSYLLAYQLGCKDVTVYRDNSIKNQVLNAPKKKVETVEAMPAQPSHGQPMAVTAQAAPKGMLTQATYTGSSTLLLSNPAGGQLPTVPSNGKFGDLKNCPECSTSLKIAEGCTSCVECGWALCK